MKCWCRVNVSSKWGREVAHPAGAEVLDLGDSTLLPGLIDAHVHLFLHPGAEDLQTVEESVPQRTILADTCAGPISWQALPPSVDMGTEGAGSADTAVRNAIDQGLVPGPRLRISGNAVDILGGHEDANHLQSHRTTRAVERDLCQQSRGTCSRDPRAVERRRRFHQDL